MKKVVLVARKVEIQFLRTYITHDPLAVQMEYCAKTIETWPSLPAGVD